MQIINFLLAFLLPLLAFAQDPAAAGEETSTLSTSTETHTRTIKVSQISTITSVMTAPTAITNSTSVYPTSTHVSLSASAPVNTVGSPAPTGSGDPTEFEGAASSVQVASFGVVGAMALAVAALL